MMPAPSGCHDAGTEHGRRDALTWDPMTHCMDVAVVTLCARVTMHIPFHQQTAFLARVTPVPAGTVVSSQSFSTPRQRLRPRVKRLIGNQLPVRRPIGEETLATLLCGPGCTRCVGSVSPAWYPEACSSWPFMRRVNFS